MAGNDTNTQAPSRDAQPGANAGSDESPRSAGNAIENSRLTSRSDSPDRQERIAKAAYSRAERRGFEPGGDWNDWFDAEREIDAEDGEPTNDSDSP